MQAIKEFLINIYPYRNIVYSALMFLFFLFIIFFMLRLVVELKSRSKEKRKRFKEEELKNFDSKKRTVFDNQLAIKQLAAPDGLNPNPLSYMEGVDGGRPYYCRTFTIDLLPKKVKFAKTFKALFNFEDCISSVHIKPMDEAKASSQMDKYIAIIDGELRIASKDDDINRVRRLKGQYRSAENWADAIQLGENAFYRVGFVFTIYADSLEDLDLKSDTFYTTAKKGGIYLSNCYSTQPEAFYSNLPYNKLFKATNGVIKTPAIKEHLFDKLSLTTIFNHTEEDFNHANGVMLGENLKTGRPVTFDIKDPSHEGYNMFVAGKTGSGKSATVKIISDRLSNFCFRFISVDSQAIGRRGEYSYLADSMNGVNYQIMSGSKEILNFFDIREEKIEERKGGEVREIKTINLPTKIAEVARTVLVLLQGEKSAPTFEDETFMTRIIKSSIKELYEEKGIKNGDCDSLYEEGKIIEGGEIKKGKVRKPSPTISELYKKILVKSKRNGEKYYEKAYALILANLEEYVRELYYADGDEIVFLTEEEYYNLPISKTGEREYTEKNGKKCAAIALHGIASYFDGQSTVLFGSDVPFINIDLSQLPDSEKWKAREVAISFVNEIIKANSENVEKSDSLVAIFDEAHEQFANEYTRKTLENCVRTARKKNVSVWIITQNLSDCKNYDETKAIFNNIAVKIILKQDASDKAYLKETLDITNSQVQNIIDLGGKVNKKTGQVSKNHKGEICIVDNKRVCFCKVAYFKKTEGRIVETDPKELARLYKKESKMFGGTA